jgi:hypothetical protein
LDHHDGADFRRGKGLIKFGFILGISPDVVFEASIHETGEVSWSVTGCSCCGVGKDFHTIDLVAVKVDVGVSSVSSTSISVEIRKVKLVLVTNSGGAGTGLRTGSHTESGRGSGIHTGRAGIVALSAVNNNNILSNVGFESLVRIRPSIANSFGRSRIIRVDVGIECVGFLESTVVDINGDGSLVTDTFSREGHLVLQSIAWFLDLVTNTIDNASIRLHLIMNDRHPTDFVGTGVFWS